MRLKSCFIVVSIAIAIFACDTIQQEPRSSSIPDTVSANILAIDNKSDSIIVDTAAKDAPAAGAAQPLVINTKNIHPNELVTFAETLVGTPYTYGSTDPKAGFDCSGFITYVFNHFNIQVPRSSIDFTNVGEEIEEREAKRGDIILFTGTDSTEKFVGHMGLITTTKPEISFIHSSSGKAHGVTVTPLNPYYRKRFVKIIRIFKENSQ